MHTVKEKKISFFIFRHANIHRQTNSSYLVKREILFIILIIISRCHSRLWIAVISIDIITSTRFLQIIPRLINSHIYTFSLYSYINFKIKKKKLFFLLVFICWIITWLRIIVIIIDICTCLWFLEIVFFFVQHASMQYTSHCLYTYIILY
jgi:hypothetical protein